MNKQFTFPNKSDPWTMYIITGCSFCGKALDFFKLRGTELCFEKSEPKTKNYVRVFVILNDKKEKNDFYNAFKDLLKDHKTFPVIFESDHLFGGFDTLIETFGNPS